MTDLYFKFRLLHALSDTPCASQRLLARDLGCSLGKANYCLRQLKDDHLIRFTEECGRPGYELTRRGEIALGQMALHCLEQKRREYEALLQDVTRLTKDGVAAPKQAEGRPTNEDALKVMKRKPGGER